MGSKPSILIMVSNERETKILEMAFTQRNFEVVIDCANHSTYIKALQFIPDIIFIQFDNRNGIEQERFTKAILANSKSSEIHFVGYVSQHSNFNKNSLQKIGVKSVYLKPLKFSTLLASIEKVLAAKGKSFIVEEKKNDFEEGLLVLLDEKKTPTDKIEVLINYVDKLYAFPFSITKISRLLNDPNSSANDLVKVIESDSVITTNILKLSNSVAYANRAGKTTKVKDAVIKIGFNETKKIASAMAVMDLFSAESKTMGYSGIDYWVFIISVSLISESLIKNTSIDSSEIYITSLLHGFGIIMHNQYLTDVFSVILHENLEHFHYFPDTEKSILDINNFEFSAELFDRWSLPKSIGKTLRELKLFSSFPETLASTHETMAYIVSMSRIISKFLGLGRDCDSFVEILDKSAFEKIKFKDQINEGFIEKLHKNISEFIEIFGLDDDLITKIPEEPTKNRIGVYNIDNIMFIGVDNFLKINGYNVDYVTNISQKTDFMDEISIIVVSLDSDNKKVEQLIDELTKKFSAAHKERIIIIAEKDTEVYNSQIKAGVPTFAFSFDIRLLEDTIMKIIDGTADKIISPTSEPDFNKPKIFNTIKGKYGLEVDKNDEKSEERKSKLEDIKKRLEKEKTEESEA